MKRRFHDMDLRSGVIGGYPFDEEYENYEIEKNEDFMKESKRSREETIELREKAKELFFDDIEEILEERFKREKYYQYSLNIYDNCTEQ